jgi:hypothetical protein
MKDLFDFRNQVAHGKSMVVKDEVTIPAHKYKGDEHRGFVPIKWEKLCTEENVIRAREDVELIVKILHEAGGFEPSRYDFAMGGQGYSVTSNDNIE